MFEFGLSAVVVFFSLSSTLSIKEISFEIIHCSLLHTWYTLHILGNSFRSCYFLFVASPFWYCLRFHPDETKTKPEMKNQTNKLNFPWIKNDKKKNISHSWQFSITCIACIQFNLKDNYSIFCSICTALHISSSSDNEHERERSWFDFS